VSPSSAATAVSTTTTTGPATTSTPLCETPQLAVTLGSPSGTAGTTYYDLEFVDTGPAACQLNGFPYVTFANSSGDIVGAPAGEITTTSPYEVILQPHGPAVIATLAITDASNLGPSCRLTSTAELRVFPPNQTRPAYIDHVDQTCADTSYVTIRVGPVVAPTGSGSQQASGG
jgi:hypothetical protein